MARTSKGRNGETHRRPVRPGKNAPASERVQVSIQHTIFNKTFLLVTGSVLGLIVLISGGYLWYNKIYSDPEHVFWSMVDNNLSTKGVTKELTEQGPAGSSTKLTQLIWNPNSRVKSIRDLTYNNTNTKLTLEAISTPTESYQHYVKIDQGNGKDYSSIYGLWLKSDNANLSSSSVSFNDAIFNVALFGNLNKLDREQIVEMLKSAYRVEMATVEKQSVNGRSVYSYDVFLNLQKYAEVARFYAQKLGLPSASLINPNNYRSTDQIPLKFTVDVLSRQLTEIIYQQSQITESYSGYGIAPDEELPTDTVNPSEFQKAIDAVSNQ